MKIKVTEPEYKADEPNLTKLYFEWYELGKDLAKKAQKQEREKYLK